MKKKNIEEKYELTLKGLLTIVVQDEEMVDKILDAIELHARRNDKNAVILTGPDEGRFVMLEKGK